MFGKKKEMELAMELLDGEGLSRISFAKAVLGKENIIPKDKDTCFRHATNYRYKKRTPKLIRANVRAALIRQHNKIWRPPGHKIEKVIEISVIT